LCQHDAAVCLDAPEALRAVGAASGQDDADRAFVLIVAERAEEVVDG